MKLEPREIYNEWEDAFGSRPTVAQLWVVVKLCKNVRLRCRNNTAFNNFFNRVFLLNSFKQVDKKRGDGTTYPGLEITDIGESND